ncbi:MAG: hypothetical protein H6683_08315 [Deltaproteobacteria bacterium]|nr:hypothetical protein [Deltaproteobacteria bacterium]
MAKRKRDLWLSAVLAMLVATAHLPACGGDDDDNDTSDQDASDDDTSDDDDDDDTTDDIVELDPLPDGAVPYLTLNDLPVPTHRRDDTTVLGSLDGTWRFRVDAEDVGQGEAWFADDLNRDDWDTITVPGGWNALKPELFPYEGVAWYATEFDAPEDAGDEILLRFGAVFLESTFYLNGEKIGEHHGGYTPVHLRTGDLLREDGNVLVVRVDNRITFETVPTDTYFKPGKHGWYPFGGITRSVTMHRLPDAWVFKAEPKYDPSLGAVTVTLGVFADSAGAASFFYELADLAEDEAMSSGFVRLEIPEAGTHFYRWTFETEPLRRWSREAPENQYQLALIGSLDDGDAFSVEFGYRTFEVSGTDLHLNGEKDFWRGINRHSDYPEVGPTETPESIEREVELMKELHVNHTRPGHYPVDPRLLDALADAGITVVEETPVYQWYFGQMKDEALLDLATTQLAEVIERDKNNPAILAWSVGNEFANFWPSSAVLVQTMHDVAKYYDPDRATMAVLAESVCIVPLDFAGAIVDIIGQNQYNGWYRGSLDEIDECMDTMHRLNPDKPMIASEFGAGALYGRHLPDDVEPGPELDYHDHSYTEEFQAFFLDTHLDAILSNDYISGVMPWVLADFRMEWDPSTGNPHPADKTNLKGLVTHDRQNKKLSFSTIQLRYEELMSEGR